MHYEITTPGRQDVRVSMNATEKTLDQARVTAKALAASERKPMLIERVTRLGISTIVERVNA